MARSNEIFHDRDGRPQLVDCAVLFLDLLGTAGPHSERDALGQLRRTKAAIERARRMLGVDNALARMTWFSDNLNLFHPVDTTSDAAAAVKSVVRTVAFLQLSFLIRAFVARGAVTFDRFFADEDFIHGPALDRAVLLEKGRARYPRVVLDETSASIARTAMKEEDDDTASGAGWSSHLLVDRDDGVVFVDYFGRLREAPERRAFWLRMLQDHQGHIKQNLRTYDGIAGVEEKYRWLAAYHDDVVARNASQLDDPDALLVACVRPLGRFEKFS